MDLKRTQRVEAIKRALMFPDVLYAEFAAFFAEQRRFAQEQEVKRQLREQRKMDEAGDELPPLIGPDEGHHLYPGQIAQPQDEDAPLDPSRGFRLRDRPPQLEKEDGLFDEDKRKIVIARALQIGAALGAVVVTPPPWTFAPAVKPQHCPTTTNLPAIQPLD